MNKKLSVMMLVAVLVAGLALNFGSAYRARADRDDDHDRDKRSVEIKRGGGFQQSNDSDDEDAVSDAEDTEESVEIEANGDFRLTGATVNSVSSSTSVVNASLFGFSRNVNVGSAEILGGGGHISLSDINAGDKLTATGNFNETTRAITVSRIDDVSFRARNIQNINDQIQNLLNLVRQLEERLRNMQGGSR